MLLTREVETLHRSLLFITRIQLLYPCVFPSASIPLASPKEGTSRMAQITTFLRDIHIKFFARHLQILPYDYKSLDTSRLTLAYFCLAALDVLDGLDVIFKKEPNLRQAMIDFIYSLQVLPASTSASPASSSNENAIRGMAAKSPTVDETLAGSKSEQVEVEEQKHAESAHPSSHVESKGGKCGFLGAPVFGTKFDKTGRGKAAHAEAHIAQTYCALATLVLLGDDLSKVNRKSVIASLGRLQQPNGSFTPIFAGNESDMRFLFCACAISTMLDDWTGVDKDKAAQYVTNSQSYDGALGLFPDAEGHGGSTYTGIASLTLMHKLDSLPDRKQLLKWCIFNQGKGFIGRPNKPPDTCYSFWVGATINLLGASSLVEGRDNRSFNLSCQTPFGGFRKHNDPDSPPDLLHSYYGLAGLSLMGFDGLQPLDPSLGLTARARAHLDVIHKLWRQA